MTNLEREIKYLQDAEKIQAEFDSQKGWGYWGCSKEYLDDMISRLYKSPEDREENHSDTIIKNVLRNLLAN